MTPAAPHTDVEVPVHPSTDPSSKDDTAAGYTNNGHGDTDGV